MQNSNYKLNYNLDLQILNLEFLVGWLTLLVTNFWGFSVVITQILLFMLPALAALQDAKDQDRQEKITIKQILPLLVLILVVCGLLFGICKYWYADYLYASSQRSFSYFQATQKPEYLISALQSIQEAAKHNLDEPSILSELAITSAYVGASMREANATLSSQLVRLSLDSTVRATDISARNPSLYKTQARTYILLANINPKYFTNALEAFSKAAALAPTDPRIPYNQALIAKNLDATSSAKLYAQKALKLKPDFYDAQKLAE
jgi:tetratricopeptide (TPR) repeat protein